MVKPSSSSVTKAAVRSRPRARTIRAISTAEKEQNNKPCQIMVSTVGLFSFICARNVPGLIMTCRCLLTHWVGFYPVVDSVSLSEHVLL